MRHKLSLLFKYHKAPNNTTNQSAFHTKRCVVCIYEYVVRTYIPTYVCIYTYVVRTCIPTYVCLYINRLYGTTAYHSASRTRGVSCVCVHMSYMHMYARTYFAYMYVVRYYY